MRDPEVQTAAAEELNAQVCAIECMPLSELRDYWRSRWGAPPKLRSVALLRMIICWRVQADAEGGLDRRAKVKLRQTSMPRTPAPPVGTRLTREYRGTIHSVDVGDGVFSYAGRNFGSLSEVARKITGTRWNGPRFFGLRNGVAR